MIHYCAECGEEFAPVEYREVPEGEAEFCSDECEDRREFTDIYDVTFSGGAPVF
jgi:hypothetical protein